MATREREEERPGISAANVNTPRPRKPPVSRLYNRYTPHEGSGTERKRRMRKSERRKGDDNGGRARCKIHCPRGFARLFRDKGLQ